MEQAITKVTSLSEDLIIAVTEKGQVMLLNKHSLESVFAKDITTSYIYDIIKTSSHNEWLLFTESDGLIYVSWVKP
jgi:hypothetical protein